MICLLMFGKKNLKKFNNNFEMQRLFSIVIRVGASVSHPCGGCRKRPLWLVEGHGGSICRPESCLSFAETQSWTCSRPVHSPTLWPPLLDQVQTLFNPFHHFCVPFG